MSDSHDPTRYRSVRRDMERLCTQFNVADGRLDSCINIATRFFDVEAFSSSSEKTKDLRFYMADRRRWLIEGLAFYRIFPRKEYGLQFPGVDPGEIQQQPTHASQYQQSSSIPGQAPPVKQRRSYGSIPSTVPKSTETSAGDIGLNKYRSEQSSHNQRQQIPMARVPVIPATTNTSYPASAKIPPGDGVPRSSSWKRVPAVATIKSQQGSHGEYKIGSNRGGENNRGDVSNVRSSSYCGDEQSDRVRNSIRSRWSSGNRTRSRSPRHIVIVNNIYRSRDDGLRKSPSPVPSKRHTHQNRGSISSGGEKHHLSKLNSPPRFSLMSPRMMDPIAGMRHHGANNNRGKDGKRLEGSNKIAISNISQTNSTNASHHTPFSSRSTFQQSDALIQADRFLDNLGNELQADRDSRASSSKVR